MTFLANSQTDFYERLAMTETQTELNPQTKMNDLIDRLHRVCEWYGIGAPMAVWNDNTNGICEVICESRELIKPIHLVSRTRDNLVAAFDAALRAQLVPGRVEQ